MHFVLYYPLYCTLGKKNNYFLLEHAEIHYCIVRASGHCMVTEKHVLCRWLLHWVSILFLRKTYFTSFSLV